MVKDTNKQKQTALLLYSEKKKKVTADTVLAIWRKKLSVELVKYMI